MSHSSPAAINRYIHPYPSQDIHYILRRNQPNSRLAESIYLEFLKRWGNNEELFCHEEFGWASPSPAGPAAPRLPSALSPPELLNPEMRMRRGRREIEQEPEGEGTDRRQDGKGGQGRRRGRSSLLTARLPTGPLRLPAVREPRLFPPRSA